MTDIDHTPKGMPVNTPVAPSHVWDANSKTHLETPRSLYKITPEGMAAAQAIAAGENLEDWIKRNDNQIHVLPEGDAQVIEIRNPLETMFHAQAELQRLLGNDHTTMSRRQLLDYITMMTVACTDELHEALNETGWKSWSTSEHINEGAFKEELTDAFLFLLNLMIAGGMTATDLITGYQKKLVNAQKRHADQYDGVTTKCPACRRAYDNDAVRCSPAEPTQDGTGHSIAAYCVEEGRYL